MRFHKLTLTNINSLYGTHELDFDKVAGDGGMFLIRGVTGAGKSTVLDGIALALFGVTPRLRSTGATSIDGSKEGASEDAVMRVMSRGTGKCSVVLEFSLREGHSERRHYRASWGVRRARENAEGAFQGIRRKLEERVAAEWVTLIESDQVRSIEKVFRTALRGLTFEDFERTTLLAQFKFREFLDADEKWRTQILERMTAGARFREIGARAANERKAAAERVRDLRSALGALTVWTVDERAEKEALLVRAMAETARTREARQAADARREYVEQQVLLEGRVRAAHGEREELIAERAAAHEILAALSNDERVAGARAALEALRSARRMSENAAHALAQAEDEFGGASAGEAAARGEADASRRVLEAARSDGDAAQPAIEEAERAWESAERATLAAEEARAQQLSRGEEARSVERAREEALASFTTCDEELMSIAATMSKIPAWERVVSAAPAVLGKIAVLDDAQRDVARARTKVEVSCGDVADHAASLPELDDAVIVAHAHHERALEALRDARAKLACLVADRSFDEAIAAEEEQERYLEERGKTLAELLAARKVVSAAEDALEAASTRVAEDRGDVVRAQDALRGAKEACVVQAAAVADKSSLLHALDELLGVLAHRGALKANLPCPVCGADAHPYREHPERAPIFEEKQAQRAEVAKALDAAESELERAREAESRAMSDEVRSTTTLAKDEDALRCAEGNAQAAAAQASLLAASAGLSEATLEQVQVCIEAARACRTDLDARVRALRAAHEAGLDAEREESRERAKTLEAGARRREHAIRAEALVTALQHAESVLAEELRSEAQAVAGVTAELASLEAPGDDVRVRASVIAERAAAVSALANEQREHDARRRVAEVHLAQCVARGEEAARLVAQAETALAARCAEEVQAKTHAESMLSGERPSAVRERYVATLERARDADAAARTALAEASSAVAEAAARASERRGHVQKAASDEVQDRAAFEAACATAEVTSAEDVEALSLPGNRRDEAMALRRRLETVEAAVMGRVDEAEKGLEAHRSHAPRGLGEELVLSFLRLRAD